MESKLYIRQFQLVAVPLDEPMIVCGRARCIEMRELPGTNETYVYYKQDCTSDPGIKRKIGQAGCLVLGILGICEIVVPPIAAPLSAVAIAALNLCLACKCFWHKHMTIQARKEPRELTVVNEAVRNLLEETRNQISQKELDIKLSEERVAALETTTTSGNVC